VTSPRYNFVIKEGGAEAEEADWRRDDINFEGNSNNLGWGEEETTLTDGTMDPGGNVGANGSLTDNEDEIGRGSGPENDIFSSSPKIIFECSNLLY